MPGTFGEYGHVNATKRLIEHNISNKPLCTPFRTCICKTGYYLLSQLWFLFVYLAKIVIPKCHTGNYNCPYSAEYIALTLLLHITHHVGPAKHIP